ncbi:uncharacterized protein J3D65DRAFT_629259 [Phyllosticta citribraziliensis]|uniref:Uncharacterized protein n=1 Tax=Phyllosticta citribraziliensis TaxID=989973 RepID=A0ABR1LI36_9PEZI
MRWAIMSHCSPPRKNASFNHAPSRSIPCTCSITATQRRENFLSPVITTRSPLETRLWALCVDEKLLLARQMFMLPKHQRHFHQPQHLDGGDALGPVRSLVRLPRSWPWIGTWSAWLNPLPLAPSSWSWTLATNSKVPFFLYFLEALPASMTGEWRLTRAQLGNISPFSWSTRLYQSLTTAAGWTCSACCCTCAVAGSRRRPRRLDRRR